jgi:hypothetical protein
MAKHNDFVVSIYLFIDSKYGEYLNKRDIKQEDLSDKIRYFLKKVECIDGFYFPEGSNIKLKEWTPTAKEKEHFNKFAALQILGLQNNNSYFLDLPTTKKTLSAVFQGSSGPPWSQINYMGFTLQYPVSTLLRHMEKRNIDEVYKKFKGKMQKDVELFFDKDADDLFTDVEKNLDRSFEYNLNLHNLEMKEHFHPHKDIRSGDLNYDILFQNENPSDLIIKWNFELALNVVKTHFSK